MVVFKLLTATLAAGLYQHEHPLNHLRLVQYSQEVQIRLRVIQILKTVL